MNNGEIMKRVTCRSGINGWQAKLHSIYSNYREFCSYDSMYGIAKRLGFSDPKIAWETNPRIQGSVNPEDLQISS
jgi:hypothetical protein